MSTPHLARVVILAGPSGSGRSRLAACLHRAHGWPVVRLDDFYRDGADPSLPMTDLGHTHLVVAKGIFGAEIIHRRRDEGLLQLGLVHPSLVHEVGVEVGVVESGGRCVQRRVGKVKVGDPHHRVLRS